MVCHRVPINNVTGWPAALHFGTIPKPKSSVIYGILAPKGYFGRLASQLKNFTTSQECKQEWKKHCVLEPQFGRHMDALREWMESDLDVIMVGTSHGCSAGMDGSDLDVIMVGT